MIEMHNLNSKKSFSLARDELGGSSCSLASHKSHSLSPGHSRQNSTASLLEIGVDHPTTGKFLLFGPYFIIIQSYIYDYCHWSSQVVVL